MLPPDSLCLDFANTVSWRTSDKPEEKVGSYTSLVDWSRKAGIVSAREARAMLKADEPSKNVLHRAILVRESIYRILAAQAAGRRAQPSDLAILNETFGEALGHLQLVAEALDAIESGVGPLLLAFAQGLLCLMHLVAELLKAGGNLLLGLGRIGIEAATQPIGAAGAGQREGGSRIRARGPRSVGRQEWLA